MLKSAGIVLSVYCLFLLSGCVTTEQKLFQGNVSEEKEVESRVQIGIKLLQKGEAEQAIIHLKKALDINPQSSRVNEILAVAFEQIGEDKVASDHYRKMLDYDQDYTRGRLNYASFLIRHNDCKAAYKQLTIVVADIYYPSRALAFQQLGFCAQQLKRYDEVERYFKRAISLDKDLPTAYLQLALVQFDNEQFVEAQKNLDQYRVKVKSSSAEALLLGIKLAVVFEDKGDEASFAMALRNLYPRSEEYLEYIKKIKTR